MTDDEIEQAYLAGDGIRGLSRKTGVPWRRIERIVHSRGIAKPAQPRHNLDPGAVAAACGDSRSAREVAEELGVSTSTVIVALRANGTLRSRTCAQSLRFGRLTKEQRQTHMLPAQTAAMVAITGQVLSDARVCAMALGREGSFRSDNEKVMRDALAAQGIRSIPNKAVGRFNVDLGVESAMVAIEIDGGGWHNMMRARDDARDQIMIGRGWRIVRYFNRAVERLDLCALDAAALIADPLLWHSQPRIVRTSITQLLSCQETAVI